MELANFILPVLALTVSGLVWNNFGYFAAWRKNHNNPEWEGFNAGKLRNDLILGTVLGIGAVVATILQSGELSPIATAQDFIIAIGSGFGVVAAVDKFIIGGLFGKS